MVGSEMQIRQWYHRWLHGNDNSVYKLMSTSVDDMRMLSQLITASSSHQHDTQAKTHRYSISGSLHSMVPTELMTAIRWCFLLADIE